MLSLLIYNYIIFFFLVFFLLNVYYRFNTTFLSSTGQVNTLFYLTLAAVVYIAASLMFISYDIYLSTLFTAKGLFLLSGKFLSLFYFPFIYIFLLVTVVSLLFCLNYNMSELFSFLVYIAIIFLSGLGLFYSDSIILFFVFYEFLLVPSFIILYRYSKTRRSVEAAFLMFFWTQFGAIFLIFAFFYIFLVTSSTSFSTLALFNFTPFEVNFIFLFFLVGFGVKLPIWPFYDWLPKAHVEASTNFSIFLSGVLVKFAFFGFLKCLLLLESEPNFIFIFPYLLIGIVDSVLKVFHQIDIKKLVAFCTVVEMHWLLICVVSGQSYLWLSGFAMLISHAIISTNSFLMVDAIARRFKTRLVTEISGLNFLCPKLFLLTLANCIVFLGFPGSLFFIAEFLFFSFLIDAFPLLALILAFLLYIILAIFFLRLWMNILFSSISHYKNSVVQDVDKSEFLIFSFFLVLVFWLGNTWQTFIF